MLIITIPCVAGSLGEPDCFFQEEDALERIRDFQSTYAGKESGYAELLVIHLPRVPAIAVGTPLQFEIVSGDDK